MKASICKRLQRLEHAVAGHERMPIALIDATKLPAADREAYWAGDLGVLRQHSAPDPSGYPEGTVHTIVIDMHPACRYLRDAAHDLDEDEA